MFAVFNIQGKSFCGVKGSILKLQAARDKDITVNKVILVRDNDKIITNCDDVKIDIAIVRTTKENFYGMKTRRRKASRRTYAGRNEFTYIKVENIKLK